VQDNLYLGAHLTTPRLGYVHHGIYAGNGRVIHYGGFSHFLRSRPVEEVSIDEFADGHGYAVKAWAAPQFTGEHVVARARSRLGEDLYRLLSNNCEHFAEWCIGGRSRSAQVEKWIGALRRSFAPLAQSARA
jgi:hypothetical protein